MAKGIDYAACITAVVLFAISCYYLHQYSIHDAKTNWKRISIFALYFCCPATLIHPFYIKIKTGKPIGLIHNKYKPLMNSVGLIVAGMAVPFFEQGYSYWAMLASISAMGSALFASLFLRPLSVDFGLVGMLCSFSFKLSYDRIHTSAAEWIRNFMACVVVICVKHLVDIESTEVRQSVPPRHPLRHYPAPVLSALTRRLHAGVTVPGVAGVAVPVVAGIADPGVAGAKLLHQLEERMEAHMRDISQIMRDIELVRLAVQNQNRGGDAE